MAGREQAKTKGEAVLSLGNFVYWRSRKTSAETRGKKNVRDLGIGYFTVPSYVR